MITCMQHEQWMLTEGIVGREGIQILCEALRTNTTLTELNLSSKDEITKPMKQKQKKLF